MREPSRRQSRQTTYLVVRKLVSNFVKPQELMEDGSAPRRSTPPARRSRSAEFHNFSERRRRDKINEKLKALQELLPNCNKTDKVSMLDEAIDYLKSLQLQLQMLVMGKGMSPVVPLELQQYMHYITADPAQLPPLRPSGQQHRQFQITQANPQRQSNVESDFLSQMQNLHSSEPPQNFLRPPKLQLYTPEQRGGLPSTSHNTGWISGSSSYNFME